VLNPGKEGRGCQPNNAKEKNLKAQPIRNLKEGIGVVGRRGRGGDRLVNYRTGKGDSSERRSGI